MVNCVYGEVCGEVICNVYVFCMNGCYNMVWDIMGVDVDEYMDKENSFYWYWWNICGWWWEYICFSVVSL